MLNWRDGRIYGYQMVLDPNTVLVHEGFCCCVHQRYTRMEWDEFQDDDVVLYYTSRQGSSWYGTRMRACERYGTVYTMMSRTYKFTLDDFP